MNKGPSPRYPQSAIWHLDVGMVEFCGGRVDAAVQELRRAVDGGLQTDFSYAFLAAAEAILGNDANAKSALAEALRPRPSTHCQIVQVHQDSAIA
jgi:hypothetical protein